MFTFQCHCDDICLMTNKEQRHWLHIIKLCILGKCISIDKSVIFLEWPKWPKSLQGPLSVTDSKIVVAVKTFSSDARRTATWELRRCVPVESSRYKCGNQKSSATDSGKSNWRHNQPIGSGRTQCPSTRDISSKISSYIYVWLTGRWLS